MDEGVIGWIYKTALKNHWRVARWMDLDDLVQEGYLCYCIVEERYVDAKDVRQRMALLKTVFTNRLHDLANNRTRLVDAGLAEYCFTDLTPVYEDGESNIESIVAALADPDSRSAELSVVLAGASEYVRSALKLFTTDDGLNRLRSAYRLRRGEGDHLIRETFNERLCRLIGCDPDKVNVASELRACLTGADPLVGWMTNVMKEIANVSLDEDVQSLTRPVLRVQTVAR